MARSIPRSPPIARSSPRSPRTARLQRLNGAASLAKVRHPADPLISGNADAGQHVGWVGQSEVWITYLVLSRTSLGAPWRVALSETTQ